MSDIRQQINSVYIRHTAWLMDSGFITCVCGRDNLTITEHAKHFTEVLVSELDLEKESHPNVPISVPEFDAEGQPVMDERMVQPVQKCNFEWVTKERWVTPWVEVGDRETSEQLSTRLEANR